MRLRPPLRHEHPESAESCVRIDPPNRVVLVDKRAEQPAWEAGRAFECDFVFDSSDPASRQFADQKSVYEAVGIPIVESALQGYNACLCAYGQTGTGKTHTVVGHWSHSTARGLLPRLAGGLFVAAEKLKRAGAVVKLQASYLEIYNNRLRDLLAPIVPASARVDRGGETPTVRGTPTPRQGAASPRPRSAPPSPDEQQLKIHTHPAIGVYVEDLSEPIVKSFEELGKLVAFGERARQTAATSMNNRSSRSHAIFSIKVEVRNDPSECSRSPSDGGHRMSTVQVVDLAGRENEQDSECTGDRFRELTFINRSLFQLANCVKALSNDSQDHVPFRNSKLTLLLSESFQSNSRTCLLATLSPSASAYDDNLLTCRFLESTGRITTQPVANRFSSEDLQGQLQDELEQMRRALGLGVVDPTAGLPTQQGNQDMKSREVLLSKVSQDLAVEHGGQQRLDAKQALLAAACARAGKTLDDAQGSLEALDQANASVGASLATAENHLSAMEALLQQMAPSVPRSAAGSDRRGEVEKRVVLPPLLPVAPKEEPGRPKANGPTVSFSVSVSLPPIIGF